jgi:hypothetical protein
MSVMRIRDVYPGIRILDPNFGHPGSEIFTHPESQIQALGVKKALDPGPVPLARQVQGYVKYTFRDPGQF